MIIVGLISLPIGLALFEGDESTGFGGLGGDADFGDQYVQGLIALVIGFVWFAVLTKLYGGSPMKLAFGMRVVRADNGERVEWNHAIVRWAIPGAFSLVPIPIVTGIATFVVVIVSLVFIFTKPLRQAVWDQIAKTLVVKPG